METINNHPTDELLASYSAAPFATVRAATTGHPVLSTLHTGDAFGAVARLRALEIESRAIGESLLGFWPNDWCAGCVITVQSPSS